MKAFLKKYRKDVILIAGLLAAAGLLILGFRLFKKPGKIVTVEWNGKEIARYALSEEGTYPVRTEAGENVLVIRDGQAFVESADCRDKICVRHAPVSSGGETIVCLPHKLVFTIREGAE